MAATKHTAFADASQTGFEGKEAATNAAKVTAEAATSLRSSKSYKLVKSETGNNLYVETKEYDPLEHHRRTDKASNKGQGLGFMFCCFGGPAPQDEHLHVGYEMPAAGSASLTEEKRS